MEQLNTNIFFKISYKYEFNQIQIKTLKKLDALFFVNDILNFKYEIEDFIGTRGQYADKLNKVISLKFEYYEYNFNIYIYYDQFEYYISKKLINKAKCVLEDFTENEDELVNYFLSYLVTDLNKIKIPHNDIDIVKLYSWIENLKLRIKKIFKII